MRWNTAVVAPDYHGTGKWGGEGCVIWQKIEVLLQLRRKPK